MVDRNNATDADLIIAAILSLAAKRWDRDDYLADAAQTASALGEAVLVEHRGHVVMLPGKVGFMPPSQPDGPVVNLSYYHFEMMQIVADLAPALAAGDRDRLVPLPARPHEPDRQRLELRPRSRKAGARAQLPSRQRGRPASPAKRWPTPTSWSACARSSALSGVCRQRPPDPRRTLFPEHVRRCRRPIPDGPGASPPTPRR